MIKINRPDAPQDTVLDREKETKLRDAKNDVLNGNLTQNSFNSNLWKNKKVKAFLHGAQYKKCCYCERKRDRGETDVEHFRPKLKVSECREHSGYWWLAYDWSNLLVSCKTCNNKKGTQFPLQNEEERAYTASDPIDDESPILINPLNENPDDFIAYDTESPVMTKAIGKCERGERTVDHLTGINSIESMQERREKLENLKYAVTLSKIKKDRKYLERHLSQESSFTGLTRFYLKKLGIA